jgi:hypothetical protein
MLFSRIRPLAREAKKPPVQRTAKIRKAVCTLPPIPREGGDEKGRLFVYGCPHRFIVADFGQKGFLF